LALGTLGVVYGDIGTSPLYAFREAIAAAHAQGADTFEAIIGILSLMTWTMLLIVTLKYVLVLLNACRERRGLMNVALGSVRFACLKPLEGTIISEHDTLRHWSAHTVACVHTLYP
jgi:K+ transporter